MPLISIKEGLRLYYQEHGPEIADTAKNSPLVFLHGFTVDHRMWGAQVPFFKRQHRVITLDSRGHGKSDAPPTGYSRAERVEDLVDFADKLKIERMHLVGLSMGGTTALGFALTYPERLASLTLISTGAAGYSTGGKISKLDDLARSKGVKAAMEKWKTWALAWYINNRPELGLLMREMMDDHSGAVWADPMRGKYPRENDLEQAHRIKLPTLIMAGSRDKIFVPLAKKLATEIDGCRLKVFDGLGHMLNMEAPELCNAELESFLTDTARSA